jgi:hypothetical protein
MNDSIDGKVVVTKSTKAAPITPIQGRLPSSMGHVRDIFLGDHHKDHPEDKEDDHALNLL